jgi:hypothetical protein
MVLECKEKAGAFIPIKISIIRFLKGVSCKEDKKKGKER